jgi:hypothetical protein
MLVDPKTVTLGGLATALNGFFVTFLERCIKENEEFASGQESDCYRENCQMNDKVLVTFSLGKKVTEQSVLMCDKTL